MPDRYAFTSELWEWASRDNWFFVTVPEPHASDIADQPRMPRGFGSVRVRATIGTSTWTTSIFPGTGSWSLPVKRSVRNAERLEPGHPVSVEIELLD